MWNKYKFSDQTKGNDPSQLDLQDKRNAPSGRLKFMRRYLTADEKISNTGAYVGNYGDFISYLELIITVFRCSRVAGHFLFPKRNIQFENHYISVASAVAAVPTTS